MNRRRGMVAAGAAALAGLAAASPGSTEHPSERVVGIGQSVRGKPIRAVRLGDPTSPRKALVVGVIHGDERAGLRVTRRIRRTAGGLQGVDLWVVDSVNPDGQRADSRGNAHGVDLNRNFPYRWRRGPRDGYYPGQRPLSEPESRAIVELAEDLRPAISIWYHQPWDAVLRPCRGPAPIERRYAKLAGERTSCRGGNLRGTAISWQNHTFPGSTAFVVELGAGRIAARTVRRHARAALTTAVPPQPGASPPIKDWPIPYGPRRKRQMAAYSERHYGELEWRLEAPKQIVEHYSESASARSVHDTFAENKRDPELHELPGVCAHFVISPGGRIYRLVRETIRCRHAIGLNHVAIGIEHVGFSDAQVMGHKRQLRASLRLTQYLRCAYGIPVGDVIGHAESLSSPLYKEQVKRARGRTHGDFRHRTMRRYRRALARLGPC